MANMKINCNKESFVINKSTENPKDKHASFQNPLENKDNSKIATLTNNSNCVDSFTSLLTLDVNANHIDQSKQATPTFNKEECMQSISFLNKKTQKFEIKEDNQSKFNQVLKTTEKTKKDIMEPSEGGNNKTIINLINDNNSKKDTLKIATFESRKSKRIRKRCNKWKMKEDNFLVSLCLGYSQNPSKPSPSNEIIVPVNLNLIDWNYISTFFKRKSTREIISRYKFLCKNQKRGNWSEEEDLKIKKLVNEIGERWALINQYMPSRSGKQIRDRYLNYLSPRLKKERFSEEEDNLIMEIHSRYGPIWTEMAVYFKGRTGDLIKNRFYSYLKRKKYAGFLENKNKTNTDEISFNPNGLKKEEEGKELFKTNTNFINNFHQIGEEASAFQLNNKNFQSNNKDFCFKDKFFLLSSNTTTNNNNTTTTFTNNQHFFPEQEISQLKNNNNIKNNNSAFSWNDNNGNYKALEINGPCSAINSQEDHFSKKIKVQPVNKEFSNNMLLQQEYSKQSNQAADCNNKIINENGGNDEAKVKFIVFKKIKTGEKSKDNEEKNLIFQNFNELSEFTSKKENTHLNNDFLLQNQKGEEQLSLNFQKILCSNYGRHNLLGLKRKNLTPNYDHFNQYEKDAIKGSENFQKIKKMVKNSEITKNREIPINNKKEENKEKIRSNNKNNANNNDIQKINAFLHSNQWQKSDLEKNQFELLLNPTLQTKHCSNQNDFSIKQSYFNDNFNNKISNYWSPNFNITPGLFNNDGQLSSFFRNTSSPLFGTSIWQSCFGSSMNNNKIPQHNNEIEFSNRKDFPFNSYQNQIEIPIFSNNNSSTFPKRNCFCSGKLNVSIIDIQQFISNILSIPNAEELIRLCLNTLKRN